MEGRASARPSTSFTSNTRHREEPSNPDESDESQERSTEDSSVAVLLGVLGVWSRLRRPGAAAPPAPSITSGPANPTNLTSATFVFSAPPSGGSNQCKLDASPFAACTTATTRVYSGLRSGSHTFQVQAVAGGKTSSATSYTWVIDQTAPTVTNVTSTTANGSYKAGVGYPGHGHVQRGGDGDGDAAA